MTSLSASSPSTHGDSLAVVVATRGRAEIVAGLARALENQTRPPDAVVIVGSQESDIAALPQDHPRLTAFVGRIGSAHQRNDGLARLAGGYDYVVFFDDDFIPSRFWLERVAALFRAQADIVSVTGAVLADGIKTAGIPLAEAKEIVARRDAAPPPPPALEDGPGPYGCNMAFRLAAVGDERFDERLPMYAWLEDADFGGRMARRGRLVRAPQLWGVHLGHKAGRGRGLPLGYSQIANAAYLARKGNLPAAFFLKLAVKNLIANGLRALRPEPFIDRRGRLAGNLLALWDVLRGRITPERAAKL